MRALVLSALLCPALAFAATGGTPLVLSHTGRLLEANDAPVNSDALALTFRVYDTDAATGQQQLQWEAQCSVKVTNGFYAASLGAAPCAGDGLDTADLPFDAPRFLEVSIASTALSPRLRIGTVPTAALARNAEQLGGKPASDYALKTDVPAVAEDSKKLDGKDPSAYALDTELAAGLDEVSARVGALANAGGTVNAAGNPVHWSQLAGVPESIKNGAITSVSAQAPLSGTGTAADPLKVGAASAEADGVLAKADFAKFAAKAETTDPRFTDARDPRAGSANYVQNGTAAQAGANFNVGGNGTIGGNLTVGGNTAITGNVSVTGTIDAAAIDAAGENFVPNPDLANGEIGWVNNGGYPGYTIVRTLKTDATAPVGRGRYMEVKITSIAANDAYPIAWQIPRLPQNTDFNVSCWIRSSATSATLNFNPEGHEADWTGRVDAANIAVNYTANGKWQRVSGTFNTAAKQNYFLYLRGFTALGTWDVTGCQVTRGKTLKAFTVTYGMPVCPNTSEQDYGFCIHHIGDAYDKTAKQAAAACRAIGMRLCTSSELESAWLAGAEWCSCGWTTTGANAAEALYPMQHAQGGCGNSVQIQSCGTNQATAWGANCCKTSH